MIKIGDYEKIMSDQNIFSQIIYTPIFEARQLLEKRRKNPEFMAKIEKLLKGNIPALLKNKKCGIMARQLATPNLENRMFISLANGNGLHPVFLEYFDDKFTSNNKYKHSLGQLHIQNKVGKDGKKCIKNINVINFNKYDGKKLKEVKTLWGESLVDFHKKLFDAYDLKGFSFFNENDWYEKKDEKSIDFYTNFFLLITCFGILFENFLSSKDDAETEFTKEVVLPALEKVINLTGVKPLIVSLEPLDLEANNFWYYHLPVIENYIKLK
ncbi:hypothetical protein KKA93_00445 [Patescibacteria group bacterium]|nr:hypothetical protein [Patescibacteria group bacterium]MBU1663264.1 hypothetical protein [Patescibacteria group bacterium]MBU1933858.1 hypothetical protein [Patescibacteria group bacterium]MBU2007998.1 hypothetical protein [Patescibacteria group bacterium]MBU2233557.1 hypothetical protein [Patescibacteria group bacterium]